MTSPGTITGVSDAEALAARLNDDGMDTLCCLNPTLAELESAIRRFCDLTRPMNGLQAVRAGQGGSDTARRETESTGGWIWLWRRAKRRAPQISVIARGWNTYSGLRRLPRCLSLQRLQQPQSRLRSHC